MPARSSIAGFIAAFIFGVAISEMKIALPILSGMATIIAPSVTRSVPTMRGNAPYNGGSPVGFHRVPERNSQRPAV